jgi:hypothetical protein
MRRFVSNRWWASLLALVIAFTFVSTLPTNAGAAITVRSAYSQRTGASSPVGDFGDPDANGGGGYALPGRMTGTGSGTVAGDSRTGSSGVWSLRLQILMETIRGLIFRF